MSEAKVVMEKDEKKEERKEERMDEKKEERMDEKMKEKKEERMDERMDEKKDERMKEKKEEKQGVVEITDVKLDLKLDFTGTSSTISTDPAISIYTDPYAKVNFKVVHVTFDWLTDKNLTIDKQSINISPDLTFGAFKKLLGTKPHVLHDLRDLGKLTVDKKIELARLNGLSFVYDGQRYSVLFSNGLVVRPRTLLQLFIDTPPSFYVWYMHPFVDMVYLWKYFKIYSKLNLETASDVQHRIMLYRGMRFVLRYSLPIGKCNSGKRYLIKLQDEITIVGHGDEYGSNLPKKQKIWANLLDEGAQRLNWIHANKK